jgi:hypothetical protein
MITVRLYRLVPVVAALLEAAAKAAQQSDAIYGATNDVWDAAPERDHLIGAARSAATAAEVLTKLAADLLALSQRDIQA